MDKIQNIQKKIGVMKKDTQGYNYKYFDINQLLEKLTPLLHEEGLTLIQPLTHLDAWRAGEGAGTSRPAIATIIYEGKEKLLEFIIPLPDAVKPQDMGSAITYYRRYSLQSLFALEAEDDDASTVQVGDKPKVGKKEYQAKNKADFDAGADPLADLGV